MWLWGIFSFFSVTFYWCNRNRKPNQFQSNRIVSFCLFLFYFFYSAYICTYIHLIVSMQNIELKIKRWRLHISSFVNHTLCYGVSAFQTMSSFKSKRFFRVVEKKKWRKNKPLHIWPTIQISLFTSFNIKFVPFNSSVILFIFSSKNGIHPKSCPFTKTNGVDHFVKHL